MIRTGIIFAARPDEPVDVSGLGPALDGLAALRIAVFRDYPYLYDGDIAYERRYMSAYRDSPGAIIVGAWDGERLVGTATGTPLSDHASDFAAAFAHTDYALGDVFYCAESVLMPGWRGQGIGHTFFDLREEHARSLGYRYSAFCAVQRPADHPARPAGYHALEPFWRKRGYAPIDGAVATFAWRDVGDQIETRKPMQFWIREL